MCFDKSVFLEYQNVPDLGKVHYINPGNPIFDSLLNVIKEQYREEMLKGTILISPEDKTDHFAFFVKSQIIDNRVNVIAESVANEKLAIVYNESNTFDFTSSGKFIDLKAPSYFTKIIDPPEVIQNDEVIEWAYNNITIPLLDETKERVIKDADIRAEYLKSAFSNLILDLTAEINDLQGKVLLGNDNVNRKIIDKQRRIEELKKKREERISDLEKMKELSVKTPEVMGCAYVVALTNLEFSEHFGMSRDDEAESIAMQVAIDYEIQNDWKPEDVSKDNKGYDIKSINPEYLKRYIEVKGRSIDGGIMLSENEINRLTQLGDSAWLYIVTHCKTEPQLFRIQNPGKLNFEIKNKGIQYFLKMSEWKNKIL
jgi:hypothetical protein